MIRFVQPAGRHTRRLVVGVYLVSAAVALVLAGAFLILLPRVSPQLAFLRSSPGMATWFVAAAAIWSIMVLEDGVLTGLRKTRWVPVENGGFGLLKVGMVVPFIALFPVAGIFLSWTVAALATVIPTNVYLFARAITQHQRSAGDSGGVTIRELRRYVPYDFVGNLWWEGLILVLPLIVLVETGAATSAYFSLAWLIVGIIYLVPLAIGDSLVVELSIDPSDFEAQCKQVMVHLLKILAPAVALLVLAAPWVLRIFGPSYVAHGTGVLRLLGLSALPFIVNGTAVSSGPRPAADLAGDGCVRWPVRADRASRVRPSGGGRDHRNGTGRPDRPGGHGRRPAHHETWLDAGSGRPGGAPRPAGSRGAVTERPRRAFEGIAR